MNNIININFLIIIFIFIRLIIITTYYLWPIKL